MTLELKFQISIDFLSEGKLKTPFWHKKSNENLIALPIILMNHWRDQTEKTTRNDKMPLQNWKKEKNKFQRWSGHLALSNAVTVHSAVDRDLMLSIPVRSLTVVLFTGDFFNIVSQSFLLFWDAFFHHHHRR
jgi:hypothetical protein